VTRKIFGSSRQEVIEGRRKVLYLQLCNLYAFPEFVTQLNDDRTRGHVQLGCQSSS
jgi:hypothetical protein